MLFYLNKIDDVLEIRLWFITLTLVKVMNYLGFMIYPQ
jgi:hypothetical protein